MRCLTHFVLFGRHVIYKDKGYTDVLQRRGIRRIKQGGTKCTSRYAAGFTGRLQEREKEMIRVCYYEGCGIVYGEKEPLSDKRITHGLCPKHLEITLNQIRAETRDLTKRTDPFKVLIVEDNTPFRQWFKETLHDRFPSLDLYEAMDGEEALHKAEACGLILCSWISDCLVKTGLS